MSTTRSQFIGAPQTGLGFPHFDLILNRPQTGIGSFQWCLLSDSVEFSPALWRLLGLPAASAADHRSFLEFVHPDQRAKAARDVRAVITAGKAVFENLYRMGIAGERVQISLIRAKIIRVDRIATRLEGVVIDVTNLPKLLMRFG